MAPSWYNLPHEFRKSTIEYLDIPSRFRFARCSRDCYEKVQLSEDLPDGIKILHMELHKIAVSFEVLFEHDAIINVALCDRKKTSKEKMREFKNRAEKVFKTDSPENVTEISLENLRGPLKLLKHNLKLLIIDMDDFPYHRINIRDLENLKEIKLGPYIHHENQQVPISSGFVTMEQLRSIEKWVEIPSLTIDQVFQLKAKHIEVGYDNGEIVDLESIVNRIFDGELHINVDEIQITPTQSLENFPGVFAKRENQFGWECLMRRMGRLIKIRNCYNSIYIEPHVPAHFDRTKWIFL